MAQPLRTKFYATCQDKKNHAISGQKNHANSWDKKIMEPLNTKQKIMEPLRTKKSRNLFGQKKNHTTSQDKKMIQIGINRSNKIKYDILRSNIVQYGPICKKKLS